MIMDSMENSRLFMIALVVCNIILLILVLLFAGGGQSVSDKDLARIQDRLQMIESRLATAAFDQERLEEISLRAGEFEEFMMHGREREEMLGSRIDRLEEGLTSLMEKRATVETRPEPDGKKPKEVAKKEPAVKKSVAEKASSTAVDDPEPEFSGPAAYYTVKEGDTLYSLGRRHGITPDELRRLNGLESNTIKPGQKLRIQ